MSQLYDWLAEKIPHSISTDTVMIDVGAYHGNFSLTLLAAKKFSKAYLFEPNPNHFNALKNKFAADKNIILYPYALGNESGSHIFNCSQDDATGSLLSYHKKYHHDTANKQVSSYAVEIKKLDDLYTEQFAQEKIGFIKIDTQGFDLEVLKGAEKIIHTFKPWLMIELNFLPFYAAQASISAVFNWLSNAGYHLGGFFNDHYSEDKWLAFADGVFVPEGSIDKVKEPFFPGLASQELLDHNKHLQQVCAERLSLIESLSAEAEKRLQIINGLKNTSLIKPIKKSWIKKLLARQ